MRETWNEDRRTYAAALRLDEPDRSAGRRARPIGARLEPQPVEQGFWQDPAAAVVRTAALREAWTLDPNSDETRRCARDLITGVSSYPTSTLRRIDGEAPRTIVERWRCRTKDRSWTLAIEWTPPWLPIARIVRATPKRSDPSPSWSLNPRWDLLQTASRLHRVASAATVVDVQVLQRDWGPAPVFQEEVPCWRDGRPTTWSVEVGAPERVRGGWQVRAQIDGAPAIGEGRSPVFAILDVLGAVTRSVEMVRGLVDGLAALVRKCVPGGGDLLPDADAIELWTMRDGRVWPIATTRPRDRTIYPKQQPTWRAAMALGDLVMQRISWEKCACMLAELRDQHGVVAVEVVRRPTEDGPWGAPHSTLLPDHHAQILGCPRLVRGGASVDVVVGVGADVERREVHDASPILALVAAGELVHARLGEWLFFHT